MSALNGLQTVFQYICYKRLKKKKKKNMLSEVKRIWRIWVGLYCILKLCNLGQVPLLL